VDLWAERVSLENQMRIYEDTISEKQELVTVVERRAQEGLSSEAELRDARTEYLSDLTDLENLRLRLIEIDADFIVLGCEQLSVTQGNIPGSRETDIQTIGSSLNPELMVSRAELDVARAEAAYEEVSDFPGLDLEARVSVDDSGDTSSRIGLTINYEYNNFGRARLSNITESEMSVREQENLLRFLTTDLEQEVLADHQRSQLLTSQVIPSIQQELLSYEATLQSSIRRYEAGKLTIREVLSDINEIKQSKIAVEEALQQLEIFHNAIAYALGRYTIR
jgi:outer membrane protein TolC